MTERVLLESFAVGTGHTELGLKWACCLDLDEAHQESFPGKLDLGRVQGEAGSWSTGEEGNGCCSRDKSFEKM